MVIEVEGKHQIGNISLYTKSWKPSTPSVAKVIFIHGFNDHINRYQELFGYLASRGIEVCGFDQRGWGRSVEKPSQMGLTGPTETVISDIVSFISSHLPSSVPVFVFGHSMGGGEALVLASDPKYADIVGQIRGWIVESPLIGIVKENEPSKLTILFSRAVGKLLPTKQRFSSLPADILSRDPEVIKSLNEDPLLHGLGTLEGLFGMFDRTNDLSSGNIKLNKEVRSIWIGHGTKDKATSFEASKEWYEEECKYVEDKEFKAYVDWYHQLHADSPETRPIFAEDVGNWILSRVRENSKL
ncbi:hypothetical protein K3495_g8574 [Podosphaera aphanis]|nr:hypothetical protein K3495_g8574 [Podosphaera aphanis]